MPTKINLDSFQFKSEPYRKQRIDLWLGNIEKIKTAATQKIQPISEIASLPQQPVQNILNFEPIKQNFKITTDKQLNQFTKTIVDYTTIYILQYYICSVKDPDAELSIMQMMHRLSNIQPYEKAPSIWEVFREAHLNKLSLFQRFKGRLFFFSLYEIPIIPRVFDTYMKNIAEFFRNYFINDSTNRIQWIEKFIQKSPVFLNILNKKLENPSIEENQTKLIKCLENTIQEFFGKPDTQIATELTSVFFDYHCTDIHFEFGEKVLNRIIRRFLKKQILPNLIAPIIGNIKKGLIAKESKQYVTVINPNEKLKIEKQNTPKENYFSTKLLNFIFSEIENLLPESKNRIIDVNEEVIQEFIEKVAKTSHLWMQIPETRATRMCAEIAIETTLDYISDQNHLEYLLGLSIVYLESIFLVYTPATGKMKI